MWSQAMTNLSLSQFSERIQNKQVVILYPQTDYCNIFLSYLLQTSQSHLLYYRLKHPHTSVQQMLVSLSDELAESQALACETMRAQALGIDAQTMTNAFLDDLKTVTEPVTLYLDDVDQLLPSADAEQFFTQLTQNLPANYQLVINGRELPLHPWQTLVLEDNAAVIGTEHRQTQLTFCTNEADKPQLDIHAFGSGQVYLNGKPLTAWDGVLPRNLFFYFVDQAELTRDQIFSTFWTEMTVADATNVFHVTKRKVAQQLNQQLATGERHDFTTFTNGVYHVSDQYARHYDVAEFERAVADADSSFDDDQRLILLQRAFNLYQGQFLTSMDMPWVRQRREKLRRICIDVIVSLARLHQSAGRLSQALGYFFRALHESPIREDIHRQIMLIYRDLDFIDDAKRHYDLLATRLRDELQIEPSAESKWVHQQLDR